MHTKNVSFVRCGCLHFFILYKMGALQSEEEKKRKNNDKLWRLSSNDRQQAKSRATRIKYDKDYWENLRNSYSKIENMLRQEENRKERKQFLQNVSNIYNKPYSDNLEDMASADASQIKDIENGIKEYENLIKTNKHQLTIEKDESKRRILNNDIESYEAILTKAKTINLNQ